MARETERICVVSDVIIIIIVTQATMTLTEIFLLGLSKIH